VLRRAREVEVEVRRQPGGAGGPGEDHAQDVGVLVDALGRRIAPNSTA
jgi:hypothetical protein